MMPLPLRRKGLAYFTHRFPPAGADEGGHGYSLSQRPRESHSYGVMYSLLETGMVMREVMMTL